MTEPKQVGRYQISKELGRGGMAAVFLARDPRFNRNVAIKVLPSQFTHDPLFRARFEREAQTIAVLEHPAIVPVHDFGEDEGRPFLVMRYMAGGSLSSKLEKGPLSLTQAADILKRVASALDHAHTLGIIHRDIKPANILFDQFGNAYLADFGIAKIVEATTALTGSDLTVGTPAYMSPEQVKGEKVDGRSDIYSLGVLLFEMLSGHQPYEATTPIAVAFKHVHEPIPDIRSRNAALPSDIQNTINKAMSKKRKRRFSTANGLAKSVASLAEQAYSLAPTELLEVDDEPYLSPSPPEMIPEVLSMPMREAPVGDLLANGPDESLVHPQINQTKTSAITALPIWVWSVGGVLVLAIFAWGFFSFFSDKNGLPEITTAELTKGNPGVIVTEQATATATDLPTHTPTSTSPPTNFPTQTPTAEPTETAVPLLVESPTATPCPTPQLRVRSASVNVRTGPGTNYAVLRVAYADDVFAVIASSGNGSWYNIELGTDERGWISITVGEITAVEACDITIPVAVTIPPPPLPTATTVPSPTNTPTPSPQPSGGGGGSSSPTNDASPTPPQP